MLLLDAFDDFLARARPFALGVRLFEEVGGRAELLARLKKHVFDPKPPEWEAYKLETELAEMARAQPTRPVEWPYSVAAQVAAEEPQAVRDLREKARRLHSEHRHVHAMMAAARNDRDRLTEAKKIMDEIVPQLDRIYRNIRVFENTGLLPTVADRMADSRADLLETRQKLREKASKLKKKIAATADGPNHERWQKELLATEKSLLETDEAISLT